MIIYFIPLLIYITLINITSLVVFSKRHRFSWKLFFGIILLTPLFAIMVAEVVESRNILHDQLLKEQKKTRKLRQIAYGKDSSKS